MSFAIWPTAEPTAPLAFTYTYKGKTKTLEDFAADTRTSGLLILRGDQILHERYYMGASPDSRFISFSVIWGSSLKCPGRHRLLVPGTFRCV